MNAVNDSISSPSLSATLDAAHAAYVADQQRQQAKIQKAEAARQAQIEKEQAEARAWLATQIPSELVQYVDWRHYSHDEAEKTRMTGGYVDTTEGGARLRLQVPGAAPIAFNIRRIWNGANHQLTLFVGGSGDGCMFWVPTNGRMELDDDNVNYLNWHFSYLPNYSDFQVALGAAVRVWRESAEASPDQIDEYPELEENPAEIYITPEYPLSPLEQEDDEIGLMITVWASGWHRRRSKPYQGIQGEIDQFYALLKNVNEDAAMEFLSLWELEQDAIISACFLAGMSFGLSPFPIGSLENIIETAVAPVERRHLHQWLGIEAQIRAAGLGERYSLLDRQIAADKGEYQLAVLMHGADTGARIRNACLDN